MDNLAADFTIENNEPLTADYTIGENSIACNFEIYASGTTWGSIAGNINNQTDLINILNDKVDLTTFNDLSETVTNNYNELSGNISDLTGTVSDNYSTLSGQISDLNTTVNDNYTSLDNRLTTAEGSVLNLTDTVSSNYTELNNKITANSNNIIVLNRTVVNNNTAINNRVDAIVESFNGDIRDLSDRVTANSDDITTIQNTINTYGDIVTYNAAYFATANQGALADTALQPNDNISELVNDVGYITSASLPTVNNATITIQKNGVDVGTFTLNQSNNDTLNITVPTQASDIGAMPDTTTIEDLTTTAQLNALNSGATTTNIGQITTNANNIADLQTNKQNVILDLTTIRSNALAGKNASDTIATYGDIVTHNASEFATSAQGSLADTALQPNDNISELTNDVGYITSASLPTVNNATLTIQKNGTTVNTFTANSSTNTTANIIVPTDTLDLTNGAGYITGITSSDITTALGYTPYNSTNPNGYITGITGSDVTNALGFTPYDASNPNGYTSNIGTVTSVNNIAPVSGNVTINIPTDTADLTNGAGFITSADLPTNNVTTDTVQTITARKTFTGEKAIYFKQVATTNKLGFTLYNPSDTELGAFEYRPNTISGGALLNVNVPYSSSNYVGFRYWGTAVNVIAPKVTTAGNYFIPTHITDGNTTVTASNTGTVNISTLLPDISNFATVSQIPTNNNQLTNGAGYITGISNSDVINALGFTPYNSTNPNGYISGITSSDVASALGYTPSDTDLSNLSTTGQAIIDGKADTDLSNVSSIDSSSAVAAVLDSKVYNVDYYYKSGDTITNLLVFTGGLLTNGGQEVAFCIWLPKSMANISTVTCTALSTGFRKSNGGYMPSGGNDWNALAKGTVTIYKYSDNMLRVQVNYSNYGGTNNTPVGVYASISLSFT